MPKVELVFFSGCPSVERARQAIRAAGVNAFSEVELGELPTGHPYRKLSSPSVLVDGKLVAGSSNGGAACSLISWDEVSESLRTLAALSKS